MTKPEKIHEIQTSMQIELALKRPMQDVDLSLIVSQKSFLDSISLCVSLSGLKDDYICLCLEIDAGQWSRIKKGSAHFPPNKLEELMDLCGNEAPLIWLGYRRGYELKELESTTEQALRISEERNKELELKLAHIEDFVRKTK